MRCNEKSRPVLRGWKDGSYNTGWHDWREDFQLLGGNVVKNRTVICFPNPIVGISSNALVFSEVPGPH